MAHLSQSPRSRAGPDPEHVVAGKQPVVELLRAGASAQEVLIAAETRSSATLVEIRKRASVAGVPVRVVPRREVERVASGLNHQGVVAIAGRYRYTPFEDLLAVDSPRVLFLDGVTDPHNLGSLIRSAAGAGFGVVIPSRRAAHVGAAVRRVSAGAAETVGVARVGNLGQALDQARAAGLWIVGLDARGGETIWASPLVEPPVGLVVGAEDRGISPSIRAHCDALVGIPLSGAVGSLNVGVAGAIAMYESFRRSTSSATL